MELSERVLTNLEIVAAANAATPGLIQVELAPAEAEHYERSYQQAERRRPATRNVVLFPQPRVAAARPRERRASRSSARSGDTRDEPGDPPGWRWVHHWSRTPNLLDIFSRKRGRLPSVDEARREHIAAKARRWS